jgi:O-antigen/teichoic acid export membrane protein
MLYFRQILTLLIGLYTVRAVLNTLGVEDYGIYNVVASTIAMMNFLSASMANASQRYFSIEVGKNDLFHLGQIFNLNLIIYCLIILFSTVILETIGLWFINNKLVIPVHRMKAAQIIYQCSIISFLCSIFVSPYMAMVFAYENMSFYSLMSIFEVLLKLIMVLLLPIFLIDKLILYGLLLSGISILILGIYIVFCKLNYAACKNRFYYNKNLFKEIIVFIGWDLFGSISWIVKNQGINVLLNLFFGTIINATKGISNQVSGVIKSFGQNLIIAVRPQIVKNYFNDNNKMINLVYKSTKISYYLMLTLSIPLFFEMPIILKLWLKKPPVNSDIFVRLALINSVFELIGYPIHYVAQASGKLKLYQSATGILLLLNMPISYVVLKLGFAPYSVMVIAIILTFINCFLSIILIKRLVVFSIKNYCKYVFIPLFFVSLAAFICPIIIIFLLKESIFRLCCSIIFDVSVTLVVIYFFGLTKSEKSEAYNLVLQKLNFNNIIRRRK